VGGSVRPGLAEGLAGQGEKNWHSWSNGRVSGKSTDTVVGYIFEIMNDVIRQTAPIVIEVWFFQGVYLLTPESSPWRRPIAFGLIVAAVVTAVLIYGPVLQSAPIVPLPALAPFIAVATVLSLLAGVGHELKRELRFQKTLRILSSELFTFSLECKTLINAAMRTTTEKLADERFHQTERLHNEFGPKIRAVENELLLMPEASPTPAFVLLGQNRLDSDVSRIARAASGYLDQLAARLPQPRQWIKRNTVGLIVVGYLVAFIGAWMCLFFIDKWER
jgi:hypothetical protein